MYTLLGEVVQQGKIYLEYTADFLVKQNSPSLCPRRLVVIFMGTKTFPLWTFIVLFNSAGLIVVLLLFTTVTFQLALDII
jgi:hypothetical protein